MAAQTAIVVTGADLVLEVSEDGANIALGDGNGISEMVGDVRKFTEPAAAILAIATTPEKLASNLDKANAFLFGADQLRSVVQDGKVIGIALPKYEAGEDNHKIGITVITREDINTWLTEQGYERYEGDVDSILNIYDEYTKENKKEMAVEKVEQKSEQKIETKKVVEEPKKIEPAKTLEKTNPVIEDPKRSSSGFDIKKTVCLFTGSWKTNWGNMTLNEGNGSYTHDSGKITGLVNNNVLIGTWSEAPSYSAPKDAGDVEFRMSDDCNSFSGNWRYGSSGSWSGGWTGTRK
jgi:hypothetical protein